MNECSNHDSEWLETNGLGGFASGTVCGRRTRRYHALLLAATAPPTGRLVLVNGIEAWIEIAGQVTPLSIQHYAPDVLHPRGDRVLESFNSEPWPRWVYRLDNHTCIEQELFVTDECAAVAIRWRLIERQGVSSEEPVWLTIRPLISGRDYHSLHNENPSFHFDAATDGERVTWRPYDGVPAIVAISNGEYHHAPLWYRNFLYEREAERGLDCTEDLASPGEFRWNLATNDAVWIATADIPGQLLPNLKCNALSCYRELEQLEHARRGQFGDSLNRAASAYIVRRGEGRTIVAGYPWFTDWGRDTFIALRGLCIATGRFDIAREILLAWSSTVSEGMLPNRFPDYGETAEYNSVDASLWYIVAVHEYLMSQMTHRAAITDADRRLFAAVREILNGYIRGTRYRIHIDDDGLLAAGEPGIQLTWMDVKIGDWVVTPRVGKPVELQGLWLNALWVAKRWMPDEGPWTALLERGQESFAARFWNVDRGCLFDVVDVDHQPGLVDPALRPNQILAVGGLPISLLNGDQARQVVELVEKRLWTPIGLRTLSPEEPAYRPRYQGGVMERDSAYHQGTVWPWLMGPFVEAWLHVHGNTMETREVARQRFLKPLFEQLTYDGLGHVSEIADGEPPHTPRGCPFQAWSLGALLWLDRVVLAKDTDMDDRNLHRKFRFTVASNLGK